MMYAIYRVSPHNLLGTAEQVTTTTTDLQLAKESLFNLVCEYTEQSIEGGLEAALACRDDIDYTTFISSDLMWGFVRRRYIENAFDTTMFCIVGLDSLPQDGKTNIGIVMECEDDIEPIDVVCQDKSADKCYQKLGMEYDDIIDNPLRCTVVPFSR